MECKTELSWQGRLTYIDNNDAHYSVKLHLRLSAAPN